MVIEKVGCFKGSLTQGLFFMTVYKDTYKRPFLFSRFGIIGIYETIFIMLSGNQLINTVQSLPEADIKEVVKTCGYISTRKDGTQKLNFNDFYIALLTAKANQY